MNSIGALIDKHRNRRIRASVRNMLSHFLQDEWIANDQANHLGNLTTRFFAHNRAVIQASRGSEHPMRSRRRWYFSHATTVATLLASSCSWTAASHRCKPELHLSSRTRMSRRSWVDTLH